MQQSDSILQNDLLSKYNTKREAYKNRINERKYRGMEISEEEKAANKIFLKLHEESISQVPVEAHFHITKHVDAIKKTRLYNLIEKMPKGSLHHVHSEAYLPASYYVSLMRKYPTEFFLNFKERKIVHGQRPEPSEDWVTIDTVKPEDDHEIYRLLTLEDANSQNQWVVFEHSYMNRFAIAEVPKFSEEIFDECCAIAIKEGFTNLQLKNLLPYYPEKFNLEKGAEIKIYRQSLEKFKKIEPQFTLGLIYVSLRMYDQKKMKETIDTAYELRKQNQDMLLAFDLVQEEVTRETKEFIDIYLQHLEQQKKDGVTFPFVFHAGECITGRSDNILDSILLENCPRIGHGINLVKYPQLYDEIRDLGICVELNPVSNQILGYISDMRMHPGISYLNYGIKVSISSDDPGIFCSDTFLDFFACAFSMEFDLLDFKRCILNSIECSLMAEDIKSEMMKDFKQKWEKYVKSILELS